MRGGDSDGRAGIPYLDGDPAGYAGLALRQLGQEHARDVFDALLELIEGCGVPQLLADLASELQLYLDSLPYPLYRRHLNDMLTTLVAYHHDALPEDVRALAHQTIALLASGDVAGEFDEVDAVARQWKQRLDTLMVPRNPHSLCYVLSLFGYEVTRCNRVMARFLATALTYEQIGPMLPTHTGPDPSLTLMVDPDSSSDRLLRRFVDSAKATVAANGLPVRSEWLERMKKFVKQAEQRTGTLEPDDFGRLMNEFGKLD